MRETAFVAYVAAWPVLAIVGAIWSAWMLAGPGMALLVALIIAAYLIHEARRCFEEAEHG